MVFLFRLFGIFVMAALSACAQQQQYWQNSNLGGQNAQQQLNIDSGECTAAAHQAIGPAPHPIAQPSTNNMTSFYGTTSSGAYFSGQARSANNDFSAWGPSSSIQIDREVNHRNSLANVYNGCMAQRGWSLR